MEFWNTDVLATSPSRISNEIRGMMETMGVVEFSGLHGCCRWIGVTLTDGELSRIYERVRERALDLARGVQVAELLQDLASTGMAAAFVEQFLSESRDEEVLDWHVGEALAETLLEEDYDVIFPWNMRRDERTNHASLPGADLVGLSAGPVADALLVFGEVKSSADSSTPPNVVYGKSGLEKQLERLLENRKIQMKLIRWLEARVTAFEVERFEHALANFVNSQGDGFRIIGCLIRDTSPEERDVLERGRNLGVLARAPGTAELIAWYLPIPMNDWPRLAAA